MIKFAICDDEPFMAEEIYNRLCKRLEDKRFGPYCIDCFTNGRSLLESGRDFDLIFLDIQMERPDGMETARMLRQRGSGSLFVFVTVLKECVFDAFEVQAYDYLVKPLDDDRFKRTMDRALRSLEQRTAQSMIIRKGTAYEVVPLSKIVYFEVQGRKIFAHLRDGKTIDYYDKLTELERRVDRRFFRCHRSYLVNLDYIRGCKAGQVLLSQGDAIPVSRLREEDLTQALLDYMKERNL